MTIEDLEQRIGASPGDKAWQLTSANRELVKEWLVAKGMYAHRASGMRDQTLYKCYADTNFIRSLMTRGDYNPAVARNPEPKASEPLDLDAYTVPAPAMFDLPEADMVPATEPNDPVNMLTAAIQAIAGQGVSEARMIELIHEHVPAIVRQCLSDALASIAVNLDMD